jgi:hypothetical protein
MAGSISRQFARWTSNLKYEQLPPVVVDKVKALMLIHLVASVFGQQTSRSREFVELVIREDVKPNGATIIGSDTKVTRQGAVFANTASIFSAGLFDSYRMITHPGPVLVAVSLVSAELEQKPVRDVITALAAGYEFQCRLANNFVPSTSAHGFRPAPIFSTMGAAMVAGKLMDLDEEGLVAAIAIAANSASGLNEAGRSGGGEMVVHEPNAARHGVFAASIASTGKVKGSETSIEGEAGFFKAYTGHNDGTLTYSFQPPMKVDLGAITEDLGAQYEMLSVMFRMYQTGGFNQPVIDLMAELKQRYKLEADDISEIEISMNWLEQLYPSPAFPRSWDPSVARVGSTQYCAAHVAVNGGFPVVGGRTYGPTGVELEKDQRVLDFMASKVRLIGVWNQPMFSPSIQVHMTNKTVYSGKYPYARMSWNYDELVERLVECATNLPGGQARLDSLIELTRTAEDLESVEPIYAALKVG